MIDAATDWVETFTGGRLDLPMPQRGQVNILDIAHALSLQCRFNGHCREFYSVAQHSVLVQRYLAMEGYVPRIQMMGLLHDAAEAYVGDMVRPVKSVFPNFKQVEGMVQDAIEAQLIGPVPPDFNLHFVRFHVKQADEVALATGGRDWTLTEEPEAGLFDGCWPCDVARKRYLGTYYRLAREIGIPVEPKPVENAVPGDAPSNVRFIPRNSA